MPTSTYCIYQGAEISIDEAIEIKGDKKLPKGIFQCVECSQPVRPHRGGGHASAHFEHYSRNSECSLSHPNNSRNYSSPEYYDIDDPKALEGYELDRRVLSKRRNEKLAKQCKERDKYTCQVCGFNCEVQGRHVVECHHTIMVSEGEREVSLSELVTLCPTCHRVAHTRKEPYSIAELKDILCKP